MFEVIWPGNNQEYHQKTGIQRCIVHPQDISHPLGDAWLEDNRGLNSRLWTPKKIYIFRSICSAGCFYRDTWDTHLRRGNCEIAA